MENEPFHKAFVKGLVEGATTLGVAAVTPVGEDVQPVQLFKEYGDRQQPPAAEVSERHAISVKTASAKPGRSENIGGARDGQSLANVRRQLRQLTK